MAWEAWKEELYQAVKKRWMEENASQNFSPKEEKGPMSLLTFAAVANGMPMTKEAEEILGKLWRGERVVLERHRLPKELHSSAMPKNLLQCYRAMEEKLRLFGVEIETTEEPPGPMTERFCTLKRKKVIQERDIKELQEGSTLLLPKDAVLTPLARDTAAARKITIRRERDEDR